MNYKKIYEQLVQKAKARNLQGIYVEKHHIIPKCLGGTDSIENIVKLTAEEHFVAHQLLIRIHAGNDKLVFATWRMTTGNKEYRCNNKRYAWLKKAHSLAVTKKNIGFKQTEATKLKKSLALKGKPLSEETIKKLSIARKGRVISPEWRKKLSEANKGKKHSDASKEKIRMSAIARKQSKIRDWIFSYAV